MRKKRTQIPPVNSDKGTLRMIQVITQIESLERGERYTTTRLVNDLIHEKYDKTMANLKNIKIKKA